MCVRVCVCMCVHVCVCVRVCASQAVCIHTMSHFQNFCWQVLLVLNQLQLVIENFNVVVLINLWGIRRKDRQLGDTKQSLHRVNSAYNFNSGGRSNEYYNTPSSSLHIYPLSQLIVQVPCGPAKKKKKKRHFHTEPNFAI